MNAEIILVKTDASLEKRETAAQLLFESPSFLAETVTMITEPQDLSLKALMVIEVFSRKYFEKLKPFMADIIYAGKIYSDSSSRRCLAKLFGLGIKQDDDVLSQELKKEILELSFLWLVSNEKAAVKVFSMQNIYDLRHEESWIEPELKGILEKDITTSSPGYRSRAAKILRKL